MATAARESTSAALARANSIQDLKCSLNVSIAQSVFLSVQLGQPPSGFVQHFAMLKEPLLRELMRFSGQSFGLRHAAWREWWDKISEIDFVGHRRRVALHLLAE